MASDSSRKDARRNLSIEEMIEDALETSNAVSPLSNLSATRFVLDEFSHSAKKKFGQNFLVNDAIVGKIIKLAEVGPDDFVLEVGPGIGTLTIALLRNAARVLSVERDPDLPAILARTTSLWADRFYLVEKDALDLVESDFITTGLSDAPSEVVSAGSAETSIELPASGSSDAPNKFIANLPYAVAATLILDYFQRFPRLESATVMVQKEVADRIAATPGSKNYGAYTVKLGMYAQVVGRFTVGPNNFFPPPHVDSAVIRLNRAPVLDEEGKPLSDEEVEAVCTVADASFASRRKTLSNSFKAYFSSRGKNSPLAATSDTFSQIFELADIDSSRRGETLARPEFIRLARAYLSVVDGRIVE